MLFANFVGKKITRRKIAFMPSLRNTPDLSCKGTRQNLKDDFSKDKTQSVPILPVVYQ